MLVRCELCVSEESDLLFSDTIMGGRGVGKKKTVRVTVFVVKWLGMSIDGETNRTWLKADAANVSRYSL